MSGKCKATAKGTGQRCQAWAMAGAEVCRVHGGRAPQVNVAVVDSDKAAADYVSSRRGRSRIVSGTDRQRRVERRL